MKDMNPEQEKIFLIVSYEYDNERNEWLLMNTYWTGTMKEIGESYWYKEGVLIINIIEIEDI